MKKLIFILTGLILTSFLNAQSLEDIIQKYTVANKLDKISEIKTLKLTGKTLVMGNEILQYMKDGHLTLDGEESINNKPAFRLKAIPEGGTVVNIFIDKNLYQVVKSIVNSTLGGTPATVVSFPSEYTETNGVVLPMKTSVSVMGMDMVTTFSKVEVDIPIEDSVFKLK
jgi:hypothetical protein